MDALVTAWADHLKAKSPAEQTAQAAAWVDRYARVTAAQWLGPSLLAVPAVIDEASLLQLEVELSRLRKKTDDATALEVIYGLLGHFEVMKGELQLEEALYLALDIAERAGTLEQLLAERPR